MNTLILDRVRFDQLYKCDYPLTPLPGFSRSYLNFSYLYLFLALFLTFFYVPCLCVIWKSGMMRQSCYKIMFFHGILDLILINSNGSLMGTLFLLDVEYCDIPEFFFANGVINGFAYHAHTVSAVLLAVNRCIYMLKNSLYKKAFSGYRTWIWVVCCPCFYGCVCAFYNSPAIPSAFIMETTSNPHLGYKAMSGDSYPAVLRDVNYAIAIVVLPAIYATFFVLYRCLNRNAVVHLTSDESKKYSRYVLIQICVLCSLSSIACILRYVSRFTPSSVPFYITNRTLFMLCFGSSSLTYLCINKSIRNNVFLLLKLKRNNTASSFGS